MLIPSKWFTKKKSNFILGSYDENYIKCWGFIWLNVPKKRNRVKIYRRKEMTIYSLVLCVKRATQYATFPIKLFNYYLASIKLYFKLIKIRSLTHSPLLMWRGMEYLRKPHYRSQAIDPMYHPMTMLRTAFILRALRLAEKCYNRSYIIIQCTHKMYIHDIQSLTHHDISVKGRKWEIGY